MPQLCLSFAFCHLLENWVIILIDVLSNTLAAFKLASNDVDAVVSNRLDRCRVTTDKTFSKSESVKVFKVAVPRGFFQNSCSSPTALRCIPESTPPTLIVVAIENVRDDAGKRRSLQAARGLK
jgi:hypothetical protein